jgi:hypothetical protein
LRERNKAYEDSSDDEKKVETYEEQISCYSSMSELGGVVDENAK